MPIKSLESFLFENKLVNTSSIDILHNSTIGIDVEHYLSRIYTYKKEQYLSGIGGVPSSLKQYIQSDLNVFEQSNIRPLFVLPGLKINHSHKYQTNELSPHEQHLDATWARLHSKQAISGGNNFGFIGDSFRLNLDPLPIKPMMNDLVQLFIECGVDYMISPYDASFQLAYLYWSDVIDCIYGSTDMLLTNIDKFILGMEFQSKDFRFVDKQRVLNELNLNERQFLDLSIMVGCSAQPDTFSNFPPIPKLTPLSPFPQMNYFRIALDILFQYSTMSGPPPDLFAYITSLNDQTLLDLYYRGHAAIKYMPIMNTDGLVELFMVQMSKLGKGVNDDLFQIDLPSKLSTDEDDAVSGTVCIPSELHSVLSQRLPPEIYFYQSLGLLPLKLIEAITIGEYSVRPPLAIGDKDGYKKLISATKLQDVLDFQFNLITQLLARYYQVKRIEVNYWFKQEPVYLNNRLEPSVSARLRSANSCQIMYGDTSSLWSIFRTPSPRASSVVSSEKDMLSTSFRRALFLMQVMDENGTFSGVGKVLQQFCEEFPEVGDKTLEDLFLLLLYCESEGIGSISQDENLARSLKGSNDNLTNAELNADEMKQISLISRIFATQKFNIHPINYQGPISRSLLAFRSHLKVFHDAIQNSLLACFIDLVVRDEEFKSSKLKKEDWCHIIERIPYYKDLNNTLLGVISEIYFGICLKSSKSGNSVVQCIEASKDHLLNFVFQVGKPSHNINLNSVNSVTPEQLNSDFIEGAKFWGHFKNLFRIVGKMEPPILSVSDLKLVEGADMIVQRFAISGEY